MPRPKPQRRSIRIQGYDYASPGAYFVTVCAANGACLFGFVVDDEMRENALGRLIKSEWMALGSRFGGIEIDAFVVMPNHLHGIVSLTRAGQAPPLHVLIGSFKAGSRRAGRSLWQRGYYERVLRDERELAAVREYIVDNPLRWSLDRENPDRRRS